MSRHDSLFRSQDFEMPLGRLFVVIALVPVASGLAGRCVAQAPADPPAAAKHFDTTIAPLLASHCLECHSGVEKKGSLDLSRPETALAGGDSGAALVPGKPEESYLLQRIAADEMPPKHPLSDADKKTLREWIAAGAVWGTNPVDRLRYTTSVRAGYDWWCLQPVARPALPTVQKQDWARKPLDYFILSRLEAEGLTPSPEANRRTLIRRVYFDLAGLPPTPEAVAAFVADTDPQAYERLVDGLLASPAYGERWARHWLDLARFGESNGFEYDEPRKNAWPYRDWVIDALNRDLPYDEFARQQLAGDVLSPGDTEAIKATGFLVAGAYDTAGQVQQSAVMKAVVREDELEDMVGVTCQTFLALTVNCARCHDHKFDPIRQSEYYQLTAALAGVRHGERDVTNASESRRIAEQMTETQREIDRAIAGIAAFDNSVRTAILAERKASGSAQVTPPVPYARWEFDHDLQDSAGTLHATIRGSASLGEGGLVLDGRTGYATTGPIPKDLRARTLEAWVSLANLRQRGGGVITLQSADGNAFDSLVFGERHAGQWVAGSDNFSRTQDLDGPAEEDQGVIHLAITFAEDGTVTAYRNGQPYGKPYRVAGGPLSFRAGEAHVAFGMRHAPADAGKLLAGRIERAQLHDRALSAEEVAASAGVGGDFVSEAAIVARLSPESLAERRSLTEKLRQLELAIKTPPKVMCYANAPRKPAASHLLLRGDVRQLGPVVAAGGVASLVGLSAEFGLSPDAPESTRRAALARWMTSPSNPLFARVIVNRLWHYHFGLGIVDTPNDFGFNGARPTNAALLDHLAATLVDERWSLKQLHRQIVLSATYRQGSVSRPDAAQRDADNRLLWRKSPQRLEAEVVRDATLAVAGQLNPERGGPGFRDSVEVLRSGSYSYQPGDPEGDEFNRRSIYRAWIRGGRSGLLDAFDCPDPSTTSPRRALTTTPLQALVLLNNSFMLRMSDKLAERVEREVGDGAQAKEKIDAQVTRVYQLAYGREPSAAELSRAHAVVAAHGLPALARAVFNSSEFLYVD